MNWEVAAACGALGGVLPDLIKIVRKRFESAPVYFKSVFYWVNLLILAMLGAGVAIWRKPHDILEAITFGAAALTFLTQALGLSDNAKHLGAEKTDMVTRIRRWWGS